MGKEKQRRTKKERRIDDKKQNKVGGV